MTSVKSPDHHILIDYIVTHFCNIIQLWHFSLGFFKKLCRTFEVVYYSDLKTPQSMFADASFSNMSLGVSL
jgi:uncharacterized membrane protein